MEIECAHSNERVGRARIAENTAQIVHDVKNPLSSIALEVELLEARLACGDPFDAARSIGRIRRNVTFLDRLIYDLLDVCTLSNGRLALRRAPCDLQCLVVEVIDRVVPAAERHRVLLDQHGSRAPIEARIDELRIERVIANLLDNALRYTPKKSPIVVRLTRDTHNAHVSVSDGGPGLTDAERDVVFEPYRRGVSSRGHSGNGLGLYVSKQIVEAHGGYIGVESERGTGARFFFALPLV
jgi:signal transduction histidine kinase